VSSTRSRKGSSRAGIRRDKSEATPRRPAGNRRSANRKLCYRSRNSLWGYVVGCRDGLVTLVVTVFIFSNGLPGTKGGAWAQSGGAAGSAPSSEASREALSRARRAVDLGRSDEAISILEEAYQASGTPALLFELAELQFEIGHLDEARRLFARYLERNPTGSTRLKAERRLRALDLAQDKVGTPAKGARATSQGSDKGAAARSTAIPARELATRPAPLSGAPATPPGAPATSAPSHWAGWPSQIPPASPSEALASSSFLAPAAASPPPSVSPPSLNLSVAASHGDEPHEPSRALPRWVPWTGAALTAALLAGAIFTGLSANSRYDELHGSCGTTTSGCASGDIDEVRNRARTANVLWISTGAVAVATGLAAYVASRGSDERVGGTEARGLP